MTWRSEREKFPHVILHNLSTPQGRASFQDHLLNAPDNLDLRPWQNPANVIAEAQDVGILINPARSQLLELIEVRYPGSKKENHLPGPRLDRVIDRLSQFETGVVVERSWLRDRRFVHILPQKEYLEVLTSRNKPVVSEETQKTIEGYTVAIAGLSVGGGAADLLVAAGWLKFILADFDKLALSNFDRYPIADIGYLDESKVRFMAIQMYNRDPYLTLRAYEKYIGPVNGPGTISYQEFLRGADVLNEAVTPLDVKIGLHQQAQDQGIPSVMATDLGWGSAMAVNLPSQPLFANRLSSEDLKHIQAHPQLPPQEFLHYAIKMVGPENIPQGFVELLGKTPWLPQPGASARLSSALTVLVMTKLAQGEPLKSDFGVDPQSIARK